MTAGTDVGSDPAAAAEPSTPSDARPRPKILFVVTEDWFFASHFLPMARAARDAGLSAVVVCRVRDHADAIERTGARVVALDEERRRADLVSLARGVRRMTRIMRREKPDLVHCIALRSIIVGGIAARLAGLERCVFALTGGGFLSARADLVARLVRLGTGLLVRTALAGPATRFLFENASDAGLFGLADGDPRVVLVGGAGVDPDAFGPTPLPEGHVLRVAVVSRMLWSKGIDVAVEAATRARAMGAALELSLYGAPDPSNPRSIPESVLRAWSEQPGIAWRGPTRDVAQVWCTHHVCCLPSRGGEGLPRSILEAAACGRCVVTTDVPGCRDFVRPGVDGFIVPPGDAGALADSFRALADEPRLAARLGEQARARVLAGYTEAHVAATVQRLWREMLDRGAR